VNVAVPVLVSGGLTFDRISTSPSRSDHTCGLTSDGTAYCWGRNSDGQLGDSTLAPTLTPTPVRGGLTWAELDAGRKISCGIASDGLAYCWGQNIWGSLGLGFTSTTDILTPQPVADGYTYKYIEGDWWHTCAVGTDDVSYCWGEGQAGKLGDGSDTTTVSPSRVLGGLAFVEIQPGHSHTCGLATDGLVYCWGLKESLGAGIEDWRSLTPIPVLGQR